MIGNVLCNTDLNAVWPIQRKRIVEYLQDVTATLGRCKMTVWQYLPDIKWWCKTGHLRHIGTDFRQVLARHCQVPRAAWEVR